MKPSKDATSQGAFADELKSAIMLLHELESEAYCGRSGQPKKWASIEATLRKALLHSGGIGAIPPALELSGRALQCCRCSGLSNQDEYFCPDCRHDLGLAGRREGGMK